MLDVIESMKEINFEDLDHIYLKVRDAAQEIIKRKHATYYGVGMALVRITSALFDDENRILPVSVYNDGVYNIDSDLYIGLPAVLNRDGVHHVVNLKLSPEEQIKLEKSAAILKSNLKQLDI
jgi:L-lactate dehydrogenase